MNEYAELKHDFKLYYDRSDKSVGMFLLNDYGPSFEGDPLFALKVSLALASIEAGSYPTLNDGINYMFLQTYENVDQIIVGEHVDTQEELEQMIKDRDFVLNSGKLNYKDTDE